jgi:hypothetical protein
VGADVGFGTREARKGFPDMVRLRNNALYANVDMQGTREEDNRG